MKERISSRSAFSSLSHHNSDRLSRCACRLFDSCTFRRLAKYLIVAIIVTQIPILIYWSSVGNVIDDETHYDLTNIHDLRIKSICDDIWTRNSDVNAGKRSSNDKRSKGNGEGRLEFHFSGTPPTIEEIAKKNPNLQKGGFYHPSSCEARSKVAIIIPHRAREHHLRALLSHLHPILQRQQLYYKIFVIQQAGNLAFNKAKLMNIGYLFASVDGPFECFIFHDVDLLPEDDRLLYSCRETPRHLSVSIDKYQYRLPYDALIGGVAMIGKEQFRDLNGYSNKYWGWGGEDDDMFYRIYYKGYTISRPPFHLGRYKMSFHHRDKGNSLNIIRHELLSDSVDRMQQDGVNSVKYKLRSVNKNMLYTNVTVDVGTGEIRCREYLSPIACRLVTWTCKNVGIYCSSLRLFSTDDGTLKMNQQTADET